MCSIEYHQGLQCKESCLVYVLQREGLPFQSLFSQSWDLRFEESAQSLGLSIRPWELVEQLGEELGILETLRLSLNDLDSCNCLQDILIECDTYYCPWHQHFGREHFNHYYLIETVVDGIATCVDPMMSDNPQCFSFDNLAMGFRHAWLIKTHGIINNHARQFFFTKAYQHLSHMKLNFGEWSKLFISRIDQADFNVEFDGLAAGSFEVPLYRSLWSISNGHLLFSEGLSWAYLEHCDEAKKNLAMLAKAWNKYRMGIAQQFLRSHNMRLSHINSKFPSEILDLERITLDMCLSLLVLNRG